MPARVWGVALGLSGVAVMMGAEAIRGLGGDLLGEVACVVAALSYAFAGVFGRRFARVAPLVTATGQLSASTLILLPIALAVERPWTGPWPSATTWGALVALALFSTALGYILYFRLLATAGATNVLLVTLLMPVMATALGVVVLGERLELWQLVGVGFIALGLAVVDGRALVLAAGRRVMRLRALHA